MYKLGGRGGGRGGAGAAKRPPAPHGRGRGGASSIGGMGAPPRGRAAAATAAASQPAGRDETFRLESGGPPAFAAIIRLTPDLVDEIRRAEEAGGGARIKFNSNVYNSSENVIDVGGKEFKFTWAPERGELCDIYEERQSGEDGNGLLMECGSAWRKVNVQRILDESAKNLVKMRSEEAERLSKSRKSIVLDPANPSVKSQAKSMAAAAVEGNMRRMHWKHKKEFFKKNQAAVIAPTKSVSKVKLSNSTSKGNFSTSPAPSPEPGASLPSFPVGSDANNEVITPFDLNKEGTNKIEKVTPSKVSKGVNRRASAPSASVDDNTSEVRSLLISLLSENPKGMGLKALEKAVVDAFPNASKKIESIMKNIAIYQAPGRYVLKQGLEIETSKRNSSEGGGSIDENLEEAAPSLNIDDPDIFERIDMGGSPVVAGDAKVDNDSDGNGKAGSSSESGSDSDSDSDSSDSGSDSGSQSRSAAESGSGSSSDSDSDASSSSKEGSDSFVDITSDDDKANTAHTKLADDLNLSSSQKDLTGLNVDDEQIDIGTNLDYRSTSPHIDLNNFNTDDDAVHTIAASEGLDASNCNKPTEIPGNENMTGTEMDPIGVDSNYNEMSLQGNPFDDPLRTFNENLSKEVPVQFIKHHGSRRKSTSKDGSNNSLINSADKSAKPKLKRGSSNENSTARPVSSKKAKVDITSADTTVSFSEQKKCLPFEKKSNDRLNKEPGSVSRDASQHSSPAMKRRPSTSGNLQKIDRSPNVSIPTMHSERANENIEKSSSKKKVDKMQKPWRPMDGDLGAGYSHGEDHHVDFDGSDDSSTRKRSRHGDLGDDKMLKRSKDASVNVNSMNSRTFKGNVGPDGVMDFPESNESNGEPSNSQRDNVERSPHVKKMLQRELSDLELGEFRETSLENDNGRTRKQFERNNSSKSLDGKLTNANSSYTSMNNRKGPLTAFHDKSKPSPQEYGTGGHITQEGIQRKATGYDFDDNRPQQRGNVPESQHLPRTDNSDSENILYPDRSGEKKSKKETRMAHGGMLDFADKKKKPNSRLPQNGSKNAVVPRTQKSISPSDNEERSRNNSLVETDKGWKRRDSSSDEDDLFFSKYDKDEPELKGPIKDYSQYKDYVQEYHEKYEVYSYLNVQLEKTKSEYLKVEEDLNDAKERDKEQYYNILGRLNDMYRESVGRHKLMKKVFVLLHEELQAIKQRIKDFSEAYSNE